MIQYNKEGYWVDNNDKSFRYLSTPDVPNDMVFETQQEFYDMFYKLDKVSRSLDGGLHGIFLCSKGYRCGLIEQFLYSVFDIEPCLIELRKEYTSVNFIGFIQEEI